MRISDWSSDVCSSDLVAASRNRPYGDAPHVRCLIPCPPTRMRVRYHPARKPRDPGITRCDLWRIAEVEHRRALLGPLLAFVDGAEQLVTGAVGGAEIARFVMAVRRHVARLHRGQNPAPRLVGKVLDAGEELDRKSTRLNSS